MALRVCDDAQLGLEQPRGALATVARVAKDLMNIVAPPAPMF